MTPVTKCHDYYQFYLVANEQLLSTFLFCGCDNTQNSKLNLTSSLIILCLFLLLQILNARHHILAERTSGYLINLISKDMVLIIQVFSNLKSLSAPLEIPFFLFCGTLSAGKHLEVWSFQYLSSSVKRLWETFSQVFGTRPPGWRTRDCVWYMTSFPVYVY